MGSAVLVLWIINAAPPQVNVKSPSGQELFSEAFISLQKKIFD
jgi:hypothetical protein